MAGQIPEKIYFKIGEAAEIVGVKPHVLRYWEAEFKSLKPVKSRSNQRLYRREDIEQALLIKSLLYQQGFTVSGARLRLKEQRGAASGAAPVLATLDSVIERLQGVRDRLKSGLDEEGQ